MNLCDYQKLLLDEVSAFGAADYATQYHPDLSPAGWHLGHCIYTESYWIRERGLGTETLDTALKQLYVPELSDKPGRGEQIVPYRDLLTWTQRTQQENLALLENRPDSNGNRALMQDSYLAGFLSQHYAQHYETVQMIRAQRQLRQSPHEPAPAPLLAGKPAYRFIEFNAGEYRIGSDEITHYDNEKPSFNFHAGAFAISETPVSNADYLSFIEAGGYQRRELWDEAGWRWKSRCGVEGPEYWRRSQHGDWYGITPSGPARLDGSESVCGINWYEALAFARYLEARLPHEYDWEIACRSGRLQQTGQSWEWCENTLHPYPGFCAFPYEGYSVPYFDGRHFCLRGGSRYTLPIIKRPGFRNYYEADKRHIFAGLRLARDT